MEKKYIALEDTYTHCKCRKTATVVWDDFRHWLQVMSIHAVLPDVLFVIFKLKRCFMANSYIYTRLYNISEISYRVALVG